MKAIIFSFFATVGIFSGTAGFYLAAGNYVLAFVSAVPAILWALYLANIMGNGLR